MWLMNLNLAQHNDAGEVALCYYQTVNPLVEVGDHGYKFQTKSNICLAWVREEDAPKILSRKGGCCGGKRPIFRVASDADVRRWSGVASR
jgi:hypothetical protein